MNCAKCGSENVKIDVVNELSYKKGHGLLFTLLFGIYYWMWLLFKWSVKYIVAMTYWLSWAWISYIICKVTKKDWVKPEWYKKFMRKSGKMYNDQKSVAICQNCGYRKNIK